MHKIKRKRTKQVKIGRIKIGGDNPIAVQTMLKIPINKNNLKKITKQVKELENLGCEILRIAIPNEAATKMIKYIKEQTSMPIVADIHFNYKLALLSIDEGIDKIRINPGNIKEKYKIKQIAKLCKLKNIPIRVGVNAGSIDRTKYSNSAEGLVEAALDCIKLLEDEGLEDIIVSTKAHDVATTIKAYELLSERINYPLHVGITEAGSIMSSCIRSGMGIGYLLYEGIGDTIRISISGPPQQEIKAAYELLRCLHLRECGPYIVACPTCSRCQVDLLNILNQIEEKLNSLSIKKYIHIAIMGCIVNGPQEAKDADVGIACGKKAGLLFKGGKIIYKLKEEELIDRLIEEIEKICKIGQ